MMLFTPKSRHSCSLPALGHACPWTNPTRFQCCKLKIIPLGSTPWSLCLGWIPLSILFLYPLFYFHYLFNSFIFLNVTKRRLLSLLCTKVLRQLEVKVVCTLVYLWCLRAPEDNGLINKSTSSKRMIKYAKAIL